MKSLKTIAWATLIIALLGLGFSLEGSAGVVRKGDNIFLVDRTGEQWDITQAVSIGFNPSGFQFGIGRDAIRPLDASSLENSSKGLDANARVIGVENGSEAHAYVIRKLTRHEIANTRLGAVPIAAAY
ncbi:MAG: DUF3179 domain-containing protein [Desulfosarcina sp.]|nr:DUF3179 domain-containing protein [Desulfobacterales bacterium]